MRILPLSALTTAAVLAIGLAAAPLQAQTGDPAEPGAEKPISEQIEEALRGLVDKVEPALEQLRDTFRVFERIDSVEHYEEPEILPNGDIIIRRKDSAPPYAPESAPGGSPGGGPGDSPGETPGGAPADGPEPGIRT